MIFYGEKMKKIALLLLSLICLSTLPIDTNQATEPSHNFTVTGKVLHQSGKLLVLLRLKLLDMTRFGQIQKVIINIMT